MTLPTRSPIESNHAIEYFLRMQSDKAIALRLGIAYFMMKPMNESDRELLQ